MGHPRVEGPKIRAFFSVSSPHFRFFCFWGSSPGDVFGRGCSTSANTTSDNSTSARWPKSICPKSNLAEIETGRSRNWPKSKLAEIEQMVVALFLLFLFLLSFFFLFFSFFYFLLFLFLLLSHLNLHFLFVLLHTHPLDPPLLRWTPSSAGPPSAGPPKISLFFPLPAIIFILFSLFWESFH